MNIVPHNNQLSFGLLGQLVKPCTGTAEIRVQVPFKHEVFQALSATT